MPVEVTAGAMADLVVTKVDMLSEDMPRSATLRADMLVSVLPVDAVTMRRGPRAETRAMQAAHIIGMAAVTGAAVAGAAITGIRPLDIRWAITASAMAIHPMGLAITVIPTADTMVRITDTILTATDTGRL